MTDIITDIEIEDFTDELSEEVLDRGDARLCCSCGGMCFNVGN